MGKKKKTRYLPTGTCLPFEQKVYITVNGKILPCEKINHKFYLGKIEDEKLIMNFEAIAEKYNRYYEKMHKQCKVCFSQKTCGKCLFNFEDIEKENFRCNSYMSKDSFENYKNTQLGLLAKTPSAYYNIMNNLEKK